MRNNQFNIENNGIYPSFSTFRRTESRRAALTLTILFMKLSSLNRSHLRGFSLIEVAIVVAVIGVMAMIALPNLFSARKTAEDKVCIANLRAIKHAKEKWGFDEKKTEAELPTYNDIKPYLSKSQTQNICPIGGKYTLGALNENPTCEYGNLGHTLTEE